MPESQNKRPPSEPLDKTYSCLMCFYILREPVQTLCGHRYCSRCLQNVLRPDYEEGRRCQAVDEDGKCKTMFALEEIHTDKACARDIEKLYVSCPSIGCDWCGVHALYEMDHKENCSFETPNVDRRCRAECIRPNMLEAMDISDVITTIQDEAITKNACLEIMACLERDISELRMALDQPLQGDEARVVTCRLDNLKIKLNEVIVETVHLHFKVL